MGIGEDATVVSSIGNLAAGIEHSGWTVGTGEGTKELNILRTSFSQNVSSSGSDLEGEKLEFLKRTSGVWVEDSLSRMSELIDAKDIFSRRCNISP